MTKVPKLPTERPQVSDLEEAQRVIDELWGIAQELAARLGQNSRNSSKPPSSDGPSTPSNRPRSERRRGAQRGQ